MSIVEATVTAGSGAVHRRLLATSFGADPMMMTPTLTMTMALTIMTTLKPLIGMAPIQKVSMYRIKLL